MFKDDNLFIEENPEEGPIVEMNNVSERSLEITQELEEQPKENKKKISSVQTVLSVWNTMLGSSIVSIPYNVYYAGIIPTVFIGLLIGYICYLTCSVIVRLGGKEEDFAVIVYNYFYYGFGKRAAKIGRILQITFNLMINIGCTLIYFLIINQNLYPFMSFFKII